MTKSIKKYFKYGFLASLFGITILVWYAVSAETRDGLTVAFLDIGQGDATFIQTENGNQILIDGGPNRKVLSELSKIMPFYDRSIDAIIATHPDSDHIGGMPDVLNKYDVDFFIEPGAESTNAVGKELEKIVEEKKIKKVLARRGMKLTLSDNGYLLILFPDRDVSRMDTNDTSIVAKLVYGNTSFLFTGDSSQKIEKYLVSIDKENLDVDVLKTGHHGSKTSTSDALLGYVSPQYAVISAGKNNKYGHPHKEILEKLNRFGVKILRTDTNGAVLIKSGGEKLEIRN